MAITHRPGANQGIGAQIKNEVKLHPIASIGVVALVGLGIWALASRNQGTDQTATPSDSFWQGYSTAQEDFLQQIYSQGGQVAGGQVTSVAQADQGQTPGNVTPEQNPTASTASTNGVFTPNYVTDYGPGGNLLYSGPLSQAPLGVQQAQISVPAGTTIRATGKSGSGYKVIGTHPGGYAVKAKPKKKVPVLAQTKVKK